MFGILKRKNTMNDWTQNEFNNHNAAIDRGDFNTPEPSEVNKFIKELSLRLAKDAISALTAEYGANVSVHLASLITADNFENSLLDDCDGFISECNAERVLL
jgi:hypothetical protein